MPRIGEKREKKAVGDRNSQCLLADAAAQRLSGRAGVAEMKLAYPEGPYTLPLWNYRSPNPY